MANSRTNTKQAPRPADISQAATALGMGMESLSRISRCLSRRSIAGAAPTAPTAVPVNLVQGGDLKMAESAPPSAASIQARRCISGAAGTPLARVTCSCSSPRSFCATRCSAVRRSTRWSGTRIRHTHACCPVPCVMAATTAVSTPASTASTASNYLAQPLPLPAVISRQAGRQAAARKQQRAPSESRQASPTRPRCQAWWALVWRETSSGCASDRARTSALGSVPCRKVICTHAPHLPS